MKPKGKLIWGIILVAVGVILLGETTGLFSAEALFGTLIPIAMVVIGIWLISRRKSAEDNPQYAPPPPPPPFSSPQAPSEPNAQSWQSQTTNRPPDNSQTSAGERESKRISQSPEPDGSGKVRYSKTFGDIFIDCSGVSLQNIEVSAGIGDLEIRLHGGVLSDGLNRLIISSFVGDIRITASPEMAIFTHCSNFVGDVEVMGKRASGFGNSIDGQTPNYQDSDRKLYIACNSFIGDIKIYGL